jgi:hypothetical protein
VDVQLIHKDKNRKKEEIPQSDIEINNSLDKNLLVMQEQLMGCDDIATHKLTTTSGRSACIILVKGLVDNNLVQRDIVAILLKLNDNQINELKVTSVFPAIQTEKLYSYELVLDRVLQGNTVVMIDGINFALSFNFKNIETRPIEEPETERVIKGQHEGFVESVSKNISILRRKVLSNKLKINMIKLGKRSKTEVAIVYIEDIANPEIVKRVKERLNTIEIDNISGAGYIEQLTSDSPFSPFPQYQATERPDKAVANLMEGRVVLLIDNTPVSLSLPVDFFQFFQTSEDYNIHWYYGSFLRFLRFTGVIIAVFFPAMYIAILTFH